MGRVGQGSWQCPSRFFSSPSPALFWRTPTQSLLPRSFFCSAEIRTAPGTSFHFVSRCARKTTRETHCLLVLFGFAVAKVHFRANSGGKRTLGTKSAEGTCQMEAAPTSPALFSIFSEWLRPPPPYFEKSATPRHCERQIVIRVLNCELLQYLIHRVLSGMERIYNLDDKIILTLLDA